MALAFTFRSIRSLSDRSLSNSFLSVRTAIRSALCCAVLAEIAGGTVVAHADVEKTGGIKPEVATLLKQSTEAYKHMKSYEADVLVKTEITPNSGPVPADDHFLLALERPNRFCYKAVSAEDGTAAVSNGKTFINYKSERKQFMKTPAPADYKAINIVDDVEFAPLGAYVVALMLQGDALADKDVRASFQKASLGATVTENGKKWQVLHILFGPDEEPFDLYFGAEDHLLGKSVLKLQIETIKETKTEILQNIRIDKQVESANFEYAPPLSAHQVDKFTAPHRPGDARNEWVRPGSSSVRLAAYAPPAPRTISPEVFQLIKQSSEAYDKMKSYRHTSVFTATGVADGKTVAQSAKFTLEMQRLNKLAFRRIDHPNVAVVCDGKSFYDFRVDKYTQVGAPSTLKELILHSDDFDPVAGTYLVAQMILGDALTATELQPSLLKAKARLGVTENNHKWDTLEMTFGELPFTIYFDPVNHLVSRATAKVPHQDVLITEIFGEVAIDTTLPDSDFTFTPPHDAKLVQKLVDSNVESQQEADAATQAKRKAAEAADRAVITQYEGKPAPNFVAKSLNGKDISLSDFKGKIVLLEFWSSWWKPCKMVMTTLQNLQNMYGKQDVVALAVDTWDTTDDCIEYLRNNPNFTLSVLLDPATTKEASIAAKLYSVSGPPTTLIIDKNGIVKRYIPGVQPIDNYLTILKSMGVDTSIKK